MNIYIHGVNNEHSLHESASLLGLNPDYFTQPEHNFLEAYRRIHELDQLLVQHGVVDDEISSLLYSLLCFLTPAQVKALQ